MSLNQCNFIGRLIDDPETKYLPDGSMVSSFTIAINSSSKGKEYIEFVRCSAFSKNAEIAQKYLKKGKMIFISGSMRTISWDKDGEKRYSTGIIVNSINFINNQIKNDSEENTINEKLSVDDLNGEIPF